MTVCLIWDSLLFEANIITDIILMHVHTTEAPLLKETPSFWIF